MGHPPLSVRFANRKPSAIRVAQIEYAKRQDGTEAVNTAIGNVSLPMHPAMIDRLHNLECEGSPFAGGAVMYTATSGTEECNRAFLNILASSGYSTEGLHCQVTMGGSQAMELVIVGCCGPAGSSERPLLLIDPAYTNYKGFAGRLGRETVSIARTLQDDGKFTLPPLAEIEAAVREHRPGAVIVIPYDNPTGHYYDHEAMASLARICVEHDLWLVSDEAYRELYYTEGRPASIWDVTEEDVPGVTGRRISIETSSKVWNACGLRIGALVTDSQEFHTRSVAEATVSLCASAPGQYVFGALAHESHADLQAWYRRQREYYRGLLTDLTGRTRELIPGAIVSSAEASIYSVVDVRNIAPADFQGLDFVTFCAGQGKVEIDGKAWTLLTAPMSGFYSVDEGAVNPGRTQLRIAYVETPERLALVPELLAGLLAQYRERG